MCVPMKPDCAVGYVSIHVAGSMVCKPECAPACAPGYVCDYMATMPECILPNPTNFSLLITMTERFQVGYYSDYYMMEYVGESSC